MNIISLNLYQTLATQTERSPEEIAKTVIKKAIKTDQTTATDWINQQLQTLNIQL